MVVLESGMGTNLIVWMQGQTPTVGRGVMGVGPMRDVTHPLSGGEDRRATPGTGYCRDRGLTTILTEPQNPAPDALRQYTR